MLEQLKRNTLEPDYDQFFRPAMGELTGFTTVYEDVLSKKLPKNTFIGRVKMCQIPLRA